MANSDASVVLIRRCFNLPASRRRTRHEQPQSTDGRGRRRSLLSISFSTDGSARDAHWRVVKNLVASVGDPKLVVGRAAEDHKSPQFEAMPKYHFVGKIDQRAN